MNVCVNMMCVYDSVLYTMTVCTCVCVCVCTCMYVGMCVYFEHVHTRELHVHVCIQRENCLRSGELRFEPWSFKLYLNVLL